MKQKDTILIVDDIPENLELLTDLLFSNGINVTIAENAEQTFNAIKKKTPDLILLDINLPVTNGFQICERLKQSKDTAQVPVIFLTAKVSTDDIVRGFNLGAVDYITKPFNTVELLSRVKTHMELKKIRETLVTGNLKKDKFFANAVKDIKNTFTQISDATKNLKKNAKTTIEDYEQSLDKIITTSKDAMNFIESIIEWTKIHTEETEYRPRRINLKNTIEPTFNFLRSTVAIQKGIIFYSMITSDLEIFGDEKMIQIIVKNLATNMLNNSKSGDEITISAEEKNNFVEITITDTGGGTGIDNEIDIFEMDNVFNNKEDKKRNIDLILAKQLVEKHNGEISIRKSILNGLICKFTLQKNRL